MKILLTVHQFFPDFSSGTEVLTYSVASQLIALGHEVRVLTGYPADNKELSDADRFDEYRFEQIHVYRFHHDYVLMGGQSSRVEIGYVNNLATAYFDQIIKEFNPDVVHFFHLNRLGVGLIDRAVEADIPAFLTPTDFWYICPTGQLLLCDGKLCKGPDTNAGNCIKHFTQNKSKGLARQIVDKLPAAMFEFISRATIKGFLPSYPQRKEVIALNSRLNINISRLNQLSGILSPNNFMSEMLIRNGITPHLIKELTFGVNFVEKKAYATRSSLRKPFRIGFIGTLSEHKGCHVLIDAFKELPDGSALLKIYGDTEDFPEYSNRIKQKAKADSAIEFCGTFSNSKIDEVLFDFDVLVVPSLWYENTPLVIYSAQAADCPVVASNFPSISEVIRDGENGLLFEAGNIEDLVEKLKYMLGQPDLVGKFSSNSHQPKSVTRYVEQLLNVWEN